MRKFDNLERTVEQKLQGIIFANEFIPHGNIAIREGDIISDMMSLTKEGKDARGQGEILYVSGEECHIRSENTGKLHIFAPEMYGTIFDVIRRPSHYPKLEIDLLRMAGFDPIGFCKMICEDTFIFEEEEEANKAFEFFEKNPQTKITIQGWWYGKAQFFEALPNYEKENGYKVQITWL